MPKAPDRRRGPYSSSRGARNAILDALGRQPGLSRNELARLTGLSWSAVDHHAKAMAERGEVRQAKVSRRSYLFRSPSEASQIELMRLLRSGDEIVRVVHALNRKGPTSVHRLGRELRIDRKTVQRCVKALAASGHVERTPSIRPSLELRSIPLDLAPRLRALARTQGGDPGAGPRLDKGPGPKPAAGHPPRG